MTCEALEKLAGAYALDAVSEEERRAIEEHLAECLHCQQIIQELQTIVELLPATAPLQEPSKALKGRIMAAVESEPQAILIQPRLERKQQRRRRSWPTALLAAAAICLLAISSGLTAWNLSLQQQLAHLAARPVVVVHTYMMKGTTTAPEANGQLVYLPTQQSTLVTMHGLPDTTGGQVYQGWLLHCQKPVSIGLFNVVHGIASINYPGNISSYDIAAISLEPGPSASQGVPKGQIVATGKLGNRNIKRLSRIKEKTDCQLLLLHGERL